MSILSERNGGLRIFDNFQVNRSLTSQEINDENQMGEPMGTPVAWEGNATTTVFFNTASTESTWVSSDRYYLRGSNSIKNTIKNLFYKLRTKPSKVLKSFKHNLFNPKRFFEEIKGSLLTIQEIQEESKETVDLIANQAKANGQIALFDALEDERDRLEKEFTLLNAGIKLFVSEDDIKKFSENSTKSLKLDWIKNYCRFIPQKIQTELARATALKVFDNFVILHYDPENKSTKLTKKEEEAKKDPILFGVFKESKRLYYIGDWIDEYCNLTIDQFLDSINVNQASRTLDVGNITEDIIKKANKVKPDSDVKKSSKKGKKK